PRKSYILSAKQELGLGDSEVEAEAESITTRNRRTTMDNGIKVTTKIEQEAEAEATTMKQQSKSEEQQQWIMESEQLARRTKSSGDRRGASTIVQPCEFAGVKVTPLQRRRRNMARWQLTTAIRDEDDSMA
ncbi:hypothetical protein S83_051429, partial [Arachis hypogaea]